MRRLIPAALFLLTTSLFGVEGKWTPQQVIKLDPAWLKSEGLQIAPSAIWDPIKNEGLLSATVQVGGCSASFISPDGLFVTNHHCLFSILQEHATPADDIITKGYYAKTRTDELSGKSMRLTMPRGFIDVTSQVLTAIPKRADDLARRRAVEKKEKDLVAACEKRPATRCLVSELEGGLGYTLIDSLEFSDVRLVYAPPRAIGEYGGEIDNWMWPRHTGDFAIGRVYTDRGVPSAFKPSNEPYHPAHYLPISTAGVKPGDFVMIMGYPGISWRSYTAEEMTERRDLFFPRRVDVYGEWIGIFEEAARESPEAAIAVADNLKGLDNRFKNAQGEITGFSRQQIIEKQQQRDHETLGWIASHPQMSAGRAAHDELIRLVDERRRLWEHDYLLNAIGAGPKSLSLAATIVHNARERQKNDLQREPDFMERNQSRLHDRIEREQKNYWPSADMKILASWFRRAAALPEGQRIAAVTKLLPPNGDPAAVGTLVQSLYAKSRVLDLDERLKMFGESVDQLHARKDPLLDLAFSLDEEVRQLKERDDRREGALSRLRPAWRRAVIAAAGKPLAPDANSTLRISFGHVKGYSPRDAVAFEAQTSLAGVLAKNTGEEPFAVPSTILDAARRRDFGPWLDPRIGDVPVDFLADLDTTGGNSGSPVVNGKGELVGLNFDRVWENVANDFGYLPEVGRNVSVDVRYLLWILDRVDHADGLLREIGVTR